MKTEIFAFLLAFVLSLVTPVAAFDAGDAIMLVVGLVFGFVAICAFLGWWSRRSGAA